MTRIEAALAEARRVLKPGGRFLCLEFTPEVTPLLQPLYDLYSFHVVPLLGQIVTGDREAYTYLVESIRGFPRQGELAEMIAGGRARSGQIPQPDRGHRCAPLGLAALRLRRSGFGLLRSLRNLARLAAIGLILARHDALFPFAGVPVIAFYLRLARAVRAPAPARRGAPGSAARRGARRNGAELHQARPDAGDPRRSSRRGDHRRSGKPAGSSAAVSGPQARAAIEAEFERPLETLFASFDETAVAAASIAQVHFARTTDGQEVAVKVLRPGIAEAFARDLDLFLWLAGWVERLHPPLRRLKPVEIVQTLAEVVRFEMDLRFEAAAASELAENFAGDPSFRVPRIDWQRTGRRVLTLARITGTRVDDRAALLAAGHRIDELLANAAGAFFNQVFRDGFFHADLHPGNMFVDASGAIVVVDFGIMGRLDRATRYYLADMLIGFLSGDYRRVAEVHFAAGYVPPDRSVDAFTQACRAIGEPILGRAAAGHLGRPPARPAVPGHRAVRHGDPAATAAAAKDHGAGRRGRPPPRSRGQHLDLGAAADRRHGCATIAAPRRNCASASKPSSIWSSGCRD